ncbi:hypothetical protein SEUCBS139899_003541 [Sporothrix eucalyptigena]|uniref:RNase H type-1 domain-containing protein n=1 Tax=Sporothrix eucalyptigena TaxID=1812306 RepID=A0ABP0B6I3_9PEZI
MPKRTRTGDPVLIFGHHANNLVPAHLKLDLHVTPPSGNGQQPNVIATVRPADVARLLGRNSDGANTRPQELSLMLKIRVVVGGQSSLNPGGRRTAPPVSACDVLEASWSDAGISQGLRKSLGPRTGLPLRQREASPPAINNGIESQQKRQKRQSPAADSDIEVRPSPTTPKQETPEVATKPVAAKVMGGGKTGAWTATIFKPTKATLRLTGQLAPGHHMSLPYSSRSSGATYDRTLILPVDGSSPEVGEAVSGAGLSAAAIGGRNLIAGWAFAYKPGREGVISGQLEAIGLDGEPHAASRRRADLMAVLAALEYRDWAKQDGVDRLVLTTASYHMMKGLTGWLREWKTRQWHTGSNTPVQNQDLWKRVNDLLGDYAAAGCEVSVCHVPRAKFGLKMEAAAKRATRQPSP